MATLKISDLSVGDWVAVETDDLTTEHGDFATAFVKHGDIARVFVKKVLKPICVQSILGEDKFVYGRASHLDGEKTYATLKEYLRPIPITPEILEANGWRCRDDHCVWNIEDNQGTSHDGEYVITWHASDDYLTISWGGREDGALVECTIMECRVNHIHQLQHALRLAGVEKEINL